MWEETSYYIICIIALFGTFIFLVAYVYHKYWKHNGSDMFAQSSLLRIFTTLTDIFTDIIFCIILYYLESPLFMFSLLFIAIPYLLSIAIGIYFIEKLRMRPDSKYHAYFKKYRTLVVTCLIFIEFYPTMILIGSKLFYIEFFNLHLIDNDIQTLFNYHFVIGVLFENIPQLIIQFLFYFTYNSNNNNANTHRSNSDAYAENVDFTPILFITMLFSITSLLRAFLAQILRFCQSCRKRERNTFLKRDIISFRLTIESIKLKSYHRMAYNKIEKCLKTVLSNANDLIEFEHRLDMNYTINIKSIMSNVELLNKITVVFDVIIDSNLIAASLIDVDGNGKSNKSTHNNDKTGNDKNISKIISNIKDIGFENTRNNTSMKSALIKTLNLKNIKINNEKPKIINRSSVSSTANNGDSRDIQLTMHVIHKQSRINLSGKSNDDVIQVWYTFV